jgi:hypothetical protein
MRKLTLIALGLCFASSAAAQNTEIIIRRQGEKDRVIHLDSLTNSDALKKLPQQLRLWTHQLQDGSGLFPGATGMLFRTTPDSNVFRFRFDSLRNNFAFQFDTAMKFQFDSLRNNFAFHFDTAMTFRVDSLRHGLFALDTELLRGRMADLADQNRTLVLRSEDLARMGKTLADRAFANFKARPILGVNFDPRPRDSDKYGVYVTGVSPGGPADRAGIRAGDIIQKIDGKSLTDRPTGQPDPDMSLPSVRLIELVAGLQAGKTVNVEYRRGDDTRTVKVTPAEESDVMAMVAPTIDIRADSIRTFLPMQAPRGMMSASPRSAAPEMEYFSNNLLGRQMSYAFSVGGAISSLELAPLNAKLGSYFGTSEGVLVINTGDKDALGLEPGDVIASIDGRKVSSPAQFMRILLSYNKGEAFKLQITRNRKSSTLTAKLP